MAAYPNWMRPDACADVRKPAATVAAPTPIRNSRRDGRALGMRVSSITFGEVDPQPQNNTGHRRTQKNTE
jgi:hypothetical protein